MQLPRLALAPCRLSLVAAAWALAGALVLAGPAAALTFTAAMDGLQEIGPNASTATGFSTVSVVGNVLTVDVTWTGLTGGAPSAAHIHCCVPLGTNVGVAVGFPSFPAVTSGAYNHVFDLTDPTIYNPTFLANFGGGSATNARDALIAGLQARQAYTNIHNATFPGGEIRGNLVPEPSTFSLLALAIAGTAMARRVRRT